MFGILLIPKVMYFYWSNPLDKRTTLHRIKWFLYIISFMKRLLLQRKMTSSTSPCFLLRCPILFEWELYNIQFVISALIIYSFIISLNPTGLKFQWSAHRKLTLRGVLSTFTISLQCLLIMTHKSNWLLVVYKIIYI